MHTEKHFEADKSSKYFCKTKYMNDYSINFEPSQYSDDAPNNAAINVKGRFNRENYAANRQFASTEKIKQCLATGI